MAKAWIPLSECKDRHVYILAARCANVGIFDAERGEFTVPRWKFNDNYLWPEVHWDKGAGHYGTAKPLEDLGPAPLFDNDQGRLMYLNKLNDEWRKRGYGGWSQEEYEPIENQWKKEEEA